ncbi:MAG: HAMP domain-containing histidine kinase [Chloroflexia bacterium]|nr:HAMP domain-containing histidine kinase [Chloroflexia bacterium]
MIRGWLPPLRWRFILVAVGVLAVVLAVFSVVLYVNLRSSLTEAAEDGLRFSAQPVIAEWEDGPSPPGGDGTGPPPPEPRDDPTASDEREQRELVDLARRLTTLDTAARIVSTDGTLLGDGVESGEEPSIVVPRLEAATYGDVAAAGEARMIQMESDDGTLLVNLIPLHDRDSGEVIAVVEIGTSFESVDLALGRLRLVLLAGMAIALAAVVLLMLPLMRGVLRPLRQMATTSQAIAAGDLDRRVQVPPANDELTELAHSFNHMVGRLDTMLATQRRFLADASHELRSPLTALGGGVEMLLLGADREDPAARARLLRLMNGEIARMGRLVDELMDLIRFDTNPQATLHAGAIQLRPLIEQIVEEVRLLAPDHRIVAAIDPDAASLIASGDADRLRQAVLNLCTNARAATAPGGTITIGLRRDGAASARLTVADTGTGISAEDLPRVWNRFYRADVSRTRAGGQGGLGLGLAIVRAIVDAHGWAVSIDSEAGVGTTVSVTMPATGAASPATATWESPGRPALLPIPSRPASH